MIFELENVEFSYPFSTKQLIIERLSINSGDVVLVGGDSGSGKSTLFYLLKGLIPKIIKGHLAGKILYHGGSIQDDPINSSIGLLQQDPDAQLVCSHVFDELALGLENLRLTPEDIAYKINSGLKLFNLEYLTEYKIADLSGGEKQKIALLSLILTDPDALLLDEPTAFLDPTSAHNFVEHLATIASGKTIIIIEHNIIYFKSIINRFLMIENGKLCELELDKVIWSKPLPNYFIDYFKPQDQMALDISNLSFYHEVSHNSRVLFNNISLQVAKGEVVGLIGNSGSGKTTLLNLIAKLKKIDKNCGVIKVLGQDIKLQTRKQLYSKLGVLLQNPEHHFLYTTVSRELDNQLQLLAEFRLGEDLVLHNPFTLSQGQKRRLSFAIMCGLVRRELYLLDEPTFGQDYLSKQVIANLISQLQNQGKTFIIVSHDYDFIEAVCSKVIKLDSGKLNILR